MPRSYQQFLQALDDGTLVNLEAAKVVEIYRRHGEKSVTWRRERALELVAIEDELKLRGVQLVLKV